MKTVNNFKHGIDWDTNLKDMTPQSLRDGVNIEIISDGNYGAIVNLRGHKYVGRLCNGHPEKFCILGGTHTYAQVLKKDGSYEEREGIVFFTWDSENGGAIKYFDLCDNYTCLLTDPSLSEALNFDCDTCITANSLSEGDCSTIYFSDGKNEFRKIEVKVNAYIDKDKCDPELVQDNKEYPTKDSLCVISLCPQGCLQFKEVSPGGKTTVGGKSALFRYYNTRTCVHSQWSSPSPIVPITATKCNEGDFRGGKVGEQSDKKILWDIPKQDSTSQYDSIQILIVSWEDGNAKINPTTGKISRPNKKWFDDCVVEYTGEGQEITVDLADVLIDDVALEALGDFIIHNGRVFSSDFKVNNFDLPNGDITFETASTITKSVPNGYKTEDETVNSKSEFRDERIPYGIRLFDKHGNGVVCPLNFEGVEGNKSTSWVWGYPSRCEAPIFGSDGTIQALGLEVKGIKNFPEWACGFEIVRGKRIKNIVGQTPHVPGIGVQGIPTSYLLGNGDGCGDYNGDLDFLFPKNFLYGHAANLVACEVPGIGPQYYGSYEIANDKFGKGEISNAMYVYVPEYMYNVDGQSYCLEEIQQATVACIVDAVAFKKESKVKLEPALIGGTLKFPDISKVMVFDACEKDQYYYNEGLDQPKLQDVIDGASEYYCGSTKCCLTYQTPLPLGAATSILPTRPFGGRELSGIETTGTKKELIASQYLPEPIITPVPDLSFKEQRSMVMGIDCKIQDFVGLMANTPLDLFPNLEYSNNNNLNNPGVYVTNFNEFSNESIVFLDPCKNATDGSIWGGTYIMNLEKGLGDDRYGDKHGGQVEWEGTGICRFFGDNGPAMDGYDVKIFAGDAFIGKHCFKISDCVPVIKNVKADYNLIDPEDDTWNTDTLDDVTNVDQTINKLGLEPWIQYICMYLESEINPCLECVQNQFPAICPEDNVAAYKDDRQYYYNPGYSARNTLKPLFSKEEPCKVNNIYQDSIISSDIRLRGAVPNEFVDTEGFNRFRVNNITTLDGTQGPIQKLVALGQFGLYAIQTHKIWYQPIGLDTIRTVDGALVATGTGNIFGNGGKYINRDFGTQHPEMIQKLDGRIYGVDAERNAVWMLGANGGGFKVLSWDKAKSRFAEFLDSKPGKRDLHAHVDPVCGRYYITNLQKEEEHTIVWNTRFEFWETRLCWPRLLYGVGHGDRLFHVGENGLYEAYKGPRNEYLGEHKESRFTIVVNPEPDRIKTFLGIAVHSKERIDSFRAFICENDDLINDRELIQDTGWISLDEKPKNRMYHNSRFRDITKARKRRMSGDCLLIEFVIDQNQEGGRKKVVVYSVITNYKISY